MPFSGSAPNQTYSRSDGTRTGAAVCAQEKAADLNDTATLADLRENDLATAINALWLRNGGNQPSADLPMNSHKFTGLAVGSDRTDSVTLGQIQDGNLFYAEASGTANAIELATTPSFAASEGVMAIFVAEADSTSTVTVDFNGDGAVALQVGGAACSGGEINNGQAHIIIHDGTQWQLVNPARLLDLMALAKTDGNIIVGDGTNWVAESGATARTSLGLGTGDSPQFTALDIGGTDATVTRTGAGDLAIEGNIVYRAGGTDVPITDGGTGASNAASAFANLKQAASDGATGVIEIAVQSEMEAASSTTLAVTPGRQHFHPGHPKAGGSFNGTGTPAFVAGAYGMASLTDNGTGNYACNFDTAFANANFWVTLAGVEFTNPRVAGVGTKATTSVQVTSRISTTGAAADEDGYGISVWGDYA